MAAQTLAQQLSAALARYPGLDPKAVLAVAAQEGLGGGIGDQGTSFGPFQLHIGGAFPTGVAPRGQEQQWAWSQAGLDYALRHIASVAGGLHGAQAIQSIVSRFERPANPSGEIARALAAYGLPPGSAAQYQTGGGGAPGGMSAGPPGGQLARQFAPGTLSTVNAAHSAVGLPALGPSLAALLSR